jgi:hypothetical protein
MNSLTKYIEQYKDDAAHYDDYDDNKINKVLTNLNESLNSLNESSYPQKIKEFKKLLTDEQDKAIMDDFITYCKNYK